MVAIAPSGGLVVAGVAGFGPAATFAKIVLRGLRELRVKKDHPVAPRNTRTTRKERPTLTRFSPLSEFSAFFVVIPPSRPPRLRV